jgi:DNA mismatch repair protein MutL
VTIAARSPIQVLPQTAAERIAAGEVVERPASVVKELVENSLDAGARRITVEIEHAGRRLIRVTDDGDGIPAEELPLAFERFATSKIRSAADLAEIRTYGFRGEALPSIASIARVTVVTRRRNEEAAARIIVSGGQRNAAGAASGADGTTVTVEDLFFNTPARRGFLKSDARETAVIVETVEALALAAPGVAFRLVEGGREVLWAPPETFQERARRILGPEIAPHTIDVDGAGEAAEVRGIVGTPQVAQLRRTHQWFLVNGRPIRSPLLARAVAQAFHTLVPDDRHPVCVLSLRVRPDDVDVNVHPRKTEIRFTRDGAVFGDVVREVRRALHETPLIHIAPGHARGPGASPGAYPTPDPAGRRNAYESGAVAEPEILWSSPQPTAPDWPSIRLIGQLNLTYIVGESDGDLILLDQHAAHERVLFERLIDHRDGGGARAQGLVLPAVVDLGPTEAALLGDLGPALHALGFETEPFGPGAIRLMAIPSIAAGSAAGELFRACLRDLSGEPGPHAGRELEERLAIATACHTAVRAGDRLETESMAALLDALARARDPFSCFHGRPTMIRIRERDLERWFYRRT